MWDYMLEINVPKTHYIIVKVQGSNDSFAKKKH